jgi:large subunit ribosomal protein L4e
MKIPILNTDVEKLDEIDIPDIFSTPIRNSVIKKAVLYQQTHRLQPQGRDFMAGKRTSAESRGTGLGIARVPRIKGSNRAAFGVSIIGGHQAFPPFSKKRIYKKLNKKERLLAIRSGISATGKIEYVARRGHKFNQSNVIPIVVDDSIQEFKNTKEVKNFFEKLEIWEDVERCNRRKIRAGKGKMRGRKHKVGKGPLIVVNEDNGLSKAARNLPGVDVALVYDLNPEILAPGTHPGRLTIWTVSAFKSLDDVWSE